MEIPEMWMDADQCEIVVNSPFGPLLHLPLAALLPSAQLASASMEGGVLLSYSWQPPADPEEPDAELQPRQFARLIVQAAQPPAGYPDGAR